MDAVQDELVRVYSRILGIHANTPPEAIVSRETGSTYDSLIDRASTALKNDLGEFKIGSTHLTPNGNYHHGDPFKAQIDGLLSYLRAFIPAETVKRIGFPS